MKNKLHKFGLNQFFEYLPAEVLGKRFCPGENKVGGECFVCECRGG